MLTTLQIKLAIYGLVFAGLAGGLFYVKHIFNQNEKLTTENKELTNSLDMANAGALLYQENNERQVKLISEYQVRLDEKQSKNTQLERDVADGKRKLLIKGASCSSGSPTANPGTAEADPIYSTDLRSNIFRIRSGIIQLEENYALCLQVLEEDRRKQHK